jgi:glutamine synthetase
MALNTIVAESLDYIATRLEAAEGDFDTAVQELLREIITEHERIIFNGDGYSEEWHKEAEKRGLPNLRTAADAIPVLGQPEIIELFEKYNVLSRREVESRKEVKLEQYVMTIQVEANLMLKMGRTMIYPAAVRYQSELATNCANLKAAGLACDSTTLQKVTHCINELRDGLDKLETLMAHESDDLEAEARYACDTLIPAMNAIRAHADALEEMVADDLWPLPTYQEMLFIK